MNNTNDCAHCGTPMWTGQQKVCSPTCAALLDIATAIDEETNRTESKQPNQFLNAQAAYNGVFSYE